MKNYSRLSNAELDNMEGFAKAITDLTAPFANHDDLSKSMFQNILKPHKETIENKFNVSNIHMDIAGLIGATIQDKTSEFKNNRLKMARPTTKPTGYADSRGRGFSTSDNFKTILPSVVDSQDTELVEGVYAGDKENNFPKDFTLDTTEEYEQYRNSRREITSPLSAPTPTEDNSLPDWLSEDYKEPSPEQPKPTTADAEKNWESVRKAADPVAGISRDAVEEHLRLHPDEPNGKEFLKNIEHEEKFSQAQDLKSWQQGIEKKFNLKQGSAVNLDPNKEYKSRGDALGDISIASSVPSTHESNTPVSRPLDDLTQEDLDPKNSTLPEELKTVGDVQSPLPEQTPIEPVQADPVPPPGEIVPRQEQPETPKAEPPRNLREDDITAAKNLRLSGPITKETLDRPITFRDGFNQDGAIYGRKPDAGATYHFRDTGAPVSPLEVETATSRLLTDPAHITGISNLTGSDYIGYARASNRDVELKKIGNKAGYTDLTHNDIHNGGPATPLIDPATGEHLGMHYRGVGQDRGLLGTGLFSSAGRSLEHGYGMGFGNGWRASRTDHFKRFVTDTALPFSRGNLSVAGEALGFTSTLDKMRLKANPTIMNRLSASAAPAFAAATIGYGMLSNQDSGEIVTNMLAPAAGVVGFRQGYSVGSMITPAKTSKNLGISRGLAQAGFGLGGFIAGAALVTATGAIARDMSSNDSTLARMAKKVSTVEMYNKGTENRQTLTARQVALNKLSRSGLNDRALLLGNEAAALKGLI
jgi:hypothetical protein